MMGITTFTISFLYSITVILLFVQMVGYGLDHIMLQIWANVEIIITMKIASLFSQISLLISIFINGYLVIKKQEENFPE